MAVYVVSFICRMCLVTFRFSFIVRSNSSRSPAGDRSLFLFVLQRVPPPFISPPSLGFYRRRPGGIVKARRAEDRYIVSKQVLWDPNIAYGLYEIVNLRFLRHIKRPAAAVSTLISLLSIE